MPKNKDLLDRLDFLTDKLSTQVRTLGLGLLAFTGGLLVTEATKSNSQTSLLPSWADRNLLVIASLALVTLLLDLLQYVFQYASTQQTRKRLKEKIEQLRSQNQAIDTTTVEVLYDTDSCSYVGAMICFWAKIGMLVVDTSWLFIVAARFFMG